MHNRQYAIIHFRDLEDLVDPRVPWSVRDTSRLHGTSRHRATPRSHSQVPRLTKSRTPVLRDRSPSSRLSGWKRKRHGYNHGGCIHTGGWTIGGTQTSSSGPVSGTAAGNFFSVSASLVASSVGCECCVPVWNTSCELKALTRRPSGAPSLCPQFHAHKHVAATPMPLSQPEPPVPRKGVALGIECLRAQRMEKNVMATSRVPRKTTLWKLSAAPMPQHAWLCSCRAGRGTRSSAQVRHLAP